MEEYRIDLKVRNNLILNKIEEQGYSSPYNFCKETGITYASLLKCLNMSKSIYDSNGKIREFVNKLCKTLNCIPEELFSASQMEASLKDNKRILKVNEAEAIFLLENADKQMLLEDHYQHEQLKKNMENVLKTLTLREERILKMRNGLDGFHEHTLEEISKIEGINRERIRQIEARALRKLRHPFRSDNLKDFLED